MKAPKQRSRKAGLALRSAKREAGRVLRSRTRATQRSAASQSSNGGAGFTLIELLTVIGVAGILLAVAVVGFNAFGRSARLRTAGRLIGQQLDLARQRALTLRAMHGVQFQARGEPDRGRLRIYYKDPNLTEDYPTVGRWTDLPPGIEFGAASPVGSKMPPLVIEFKPTGRAVLTAVTTFKVHDLETGKERVIEVVPITGHTKVYTE